ncbi:hypothetical protein ACLB2K_015503 [Fragaria x ananassa]
MDNPTAFRGGYLNGAYHPSLSSSSRADVDYSCGACGYELNLSSNNRNTSLIGSNKYGKSIKRGIISFFYIDESRFSQVDELQCKPHFSRRSWGLFSRRTKLLCRKCGNHIGNAYDDYSSSASYPLESDGSSDCSSSGRQITKCRYDVRIRSLQPSNSEERGPSSTVTTALKDCEFPAIFNFGDSNSDTGGLAAAFFPSPAPYGETYFHMSAGRYSDGRLIIDFLANSLGHPYLSAYLDSLGTNFSYGANFATAASTIRLPHLILPQAGFSPFYVDIQYLQFLQLKSRSQLIRQRGGIFASLMPMEKYFSKALYTFDIGQNDLGEGIFRNMTVQEVNASVPDIITGFSTNIKKIYDLGARSFWIHNTGPIGCLPYILVTFPSAQKDEAGCAKAYNEVAQHLNHKLKQAVVQLRKDLPLAAFTYVDVYSVKYSLFKEPAKFGFELPLVACCGYGGKYNYNSSAGCGTTITVNGSQIFVGSCKTPSTRVVWDGIHYTEAAAKYVFNKISTGAYSDPSLPLKQACHRS